MDDGERLTILEMEYAIVAARLNAIEATLALTDKRVESITKTMVTVDMFNERQDRLERKINVIVRHLGIGDDA